MKKEQYRNLNMLLVEKYHEDKEVGEELLKKYKNLKTVDTYKDAKRVIDAGELDVLLTSEHFTYTDKYPEGEYFRHFTNREVITYPIHAGPALALYALGENVPYIGLCLSERNNLGTAPFYPLLGVKKIGSSYFGAIHKLKEETYPDIKPWTKLLSQMGIGEYNEGIVDELVEKGLVYRPLR